MAFNATKLPHEDAGVNNRKVLAFVFAFAAFTAVLVGVLGVYYRASIGRRGVLEPLQSFPAPQLQPDPSRDYEDFHKAQLDQMAGIRWVQLRRPPHPWRRARPRRPFWPLFKTWAAARRLGSSGNFAGLA